MTASSASAGRAAWSARIDRVRAALSEQTLDAFVVSTPVNIAYLTGFAGSSGLLLITAADVFLITDGRYEFAVREELARGALADLALIPVARRYDVTVGEVVAERRWRRIGFEAAHVTVAVLGTWQRRTSATEWAPVERLVERQRMIKDAGEIAVLRRAGRMLAEIAAALATLVRRHATERDIASAIELAMKDAGFVRPAFPTIVASGPNSAHPHARPTDRRLEDGDLVVLDFGGVLDGYCVDLTRMAAVGEVHTEAEALYAAVRDAHAAALATVRPGIDTSLVDAAARNMLEGRGLGEAFLHATGHGLGMEVHEAPRIARIDPEAPESDRIEAGMVFTIEPGAYVSGLGGVRLEDDVLVTAGGAEVLTEAPRDLVVV